jgi:cell division initiation protein
MVVVPSIVGMDLTPDLLLEAKFAPARRGYDMNEVDDFLERCAEGLDVLLARLRAEFDRAERAEAALGELGASDGAPGSDVPAEPTPDVVEVAATPDLQAQPAAPGPERVQEPMRILIAAERTAEAAVADARAEAERIRAEAESVASTTRSEAETLLARSRAEAEAEARKAGDEARRTIEAEVLALREDREVLSEDVRSLRRWLDDQRGRLRTAAADLQRLADDPEALGELAVPEVRAVSGIAGAPVEVAADDDAAPGGVEGDGADPIGATDESDHVLDARTADDVQAGSGGFFDDDEPTQAVPAVDASGGAALFDDERAPTNGAFFGSDAIR